jgi:hypothetical protein
MVYVYQIIVVCITSLSILPVTHLMDYISFWPRNKA